MPRPAEERVARAADEVPRLARPFVAVFLAALVICPVTALNPWPFSSWELFSRLRSDHEVAWVAVGRSGAVIATTHREATCAGWLTGAPGGRPARVYRLDWSLTDRRGDRPAPPRRTLVSSCRSGDGTG